MEPLLPGLKSAINLHPMLVHFPIAFWIAASAMWSYALFRDRAGAWRSGLWLHSAGVATAVAAVAAGYLGTSLMGHDAPGHGEVHVHRDIMLWATGVSALVTCLGWWELRGARIRRGWLFLLSIIQSVVMTVGADRGAVLVYQMGVGVEVETPAAHHSHSPSSESQR